jgi:23S rRNA pseudouridine1911/1915/1917 synthase
VPSLRRSSSFLFPFEHRLVLPLHQPHLPQDHSFEVSLEDATESKKLRLDAFLAARLPSASRARLQASIKKGTVSVNGRPVERPAWSLRPGDIVDCDVTPPPPLEAIPEDIPLVVAYEDDDVIVVDKAADMVMHPSPGHATGTLVNALLHRCGLPAMRIEPGRAPPRSLAGVAVAAAERAASVEDAEEDVVGGGFDGNKEDISLLLGEEDDDDDIIIDEDVDEEEEGIGPLPSSATSSSAAPPIRPGIVHRLDKGTTGLVVVAKTDAAHASLAAQFRDRTASRTYLSIVVGCPRPPTGRLVANVGRDLRHRKRMAAFPDGSSRGRSAASNYEVLEALAGGGAALVRWRLESGRTHQIRVHAKMAGHPLLGDETYGGGAGVSAMVAGRGRDGAAAAVAARRAVAALGGRPALHAATLGFAHPSRGEAVVFQSELPDDFVAALEELRAAGSGADERIVVDDRGRGGWGDRR